MNTSPRPVRTTILFGLFSAVGFLAVMPVLPMVVAKPMGAWCCLAAYCLLLARWGRRPMKDLVLPLAMTAAVTLLVNWRIALALQLAAFCWIRSGLCLGQGLVKGLLKELLVGVGGGLLLARLAPHSLSGWALAIWLFFLVQALYFLFPGPESSPKDYPEVTTDPFGRLKHQAEEILADTI